MRIFAVAAGAQGCGEAATKRRSLFKIPKEFSGAPSPPPAQTKREPQKRLSDYYLSFFLNITNFEKT